MVENRRDAKTKQNDDEVDKMKTNELIKMKRKEKGLIYCRQRGSNPHSVGLFACFIECRSKLRSNSKVVKYYHK
jgi:hypothetical protein